MLPDKPVALSEDSPGCALETRTRAVQDNESYKVTLNREWLGQLGIRGQGEPTLHSLTTRPVIVRHPAIVIQPADMIEGGGWRGPESATAARQHVRDILEGEIGLSTGGARKAASALADRGLISSGAAATDGGDLR